MNIESDPRPEEIDPETIKVEVNLDDASGELLGHVMDRLLEAGALDVYYVPIYMKKNRPATMLTVLCRPDHFPAVRSLIFRETTTFGMRYSPMTVHRLERRFDAVETPWGVVRVKVGLFEGEIVQQAPEYEDCRRIAAESGLALKRVYEEVWRRLGNSP